MPLTVGEIEQWFEDCNRSFRKDREADRQRRAAMKFLAINGDDFDATPVINRPPR